MTALLDSPQNRVQAYLAAGHVCTVMGWQQYEPIARKYSVPIVVTGFEPLDLLSGILVRGETAWKLEKQRSKTSMRGWFPAKETVHAQTADRRRFRGLRSHLARNRRYSTERSSPSREVCLPSTLKRDSTVSIFRVAESPDCMSGVILQGMKKPNECAHFGKRCTPSTPLGATMVSSEGACAAYYHYHRYSPDAERLNYVGHHRMIPMVLPTVHYRSRSMTRSSWGMAQAVG